MDGYPRIDDPYREAALAFLGISGFRARLIVRLVGLKNVVAEIGIAPHSKRLVSISETRPPSSVLDAPGTMPLCTAFQIRVLGPL